MYALHAMTKKKSQLSLLVLTIKVNIKKNKGCFSLRKRSAHWRNKSQRPLTEDGSLGATFGPAFCCVETVCFLLSALWWQLLFPQPNLSPFVWTPKVNHLHPHAPNPHEANPTPPPDPLSQRLCRKDAVVFAALVQGCSGGEVGTAFNTTKQSAGRRGKRHVSVACCKTVTRYMKC